MWFFDWFEEYFLEIERWFRDMAEEIYGWVWPFSYLGAPFEWIAWCFENLATAALAASQWADDVYTDAYWIFHDIIDYAEAEWDILTTSFWEISENVEASLVATYDILSETLTSIYYFVEGELLVFYPILWETLGSTWDYVEGKALATWDILGETLETTWAYVEGKALATWEILTETKETIWEWLRDSKLDTWFGDQLHGAESVILGFTVGAFGYLTDEWFKFLDRSWQSVKGSFSWLTGKLIELVDDEIDEFKDKIWDLIEKFVEKI